MIDTQKSLLTSTTLTTSDLLRASMTPAERASGRFMRAPDHGEGDPAPADPAPADPPADPAPADPVDPPADPDPADPEGSLMTGRKEGDPPADPDPATLPPEKYELTAPEGFEVDEKLLAEADPVFRDLGLTGDQANKLMPLIPKFAEALFAKQADAFQAQATDWAKAAKADPEIGGRNWAETEALVAKALDQFAGPKGAAEKPNGFRELLDNTKLGNHPEMIRMFRKIGAATGEGGSLVRSDAAAPVKAAREEVLYPNDVPKQEA